LIYCCKITDNSDVIECAFLLCSAERQKKAARLKNNNAKVLSVAAGLLLRYFLLKEGTDAEAVRYLESGKPYLENDKLHFSLSHSGEYAACVTSQNPIGIDIQKIVDIKESTVARFCTAGEIEHLKNSRDPKTDAVRFWTLKESYLKASGCSTQQAFDTEFSICGGKVAKAPDGYTFELFNDVEGYVLAVCSTA